MGATAAKLDRLPIRDAFLERRPKRRLIDLGL
jgi:hypothetical protein